MSMSGSNGPRLVIDCSKDPSVTKQSFKAESDINNIVARYARTGLVTHVAAKSPVYVDVSDVNDYREALDRIRETQTFFDGLPAKIRSRFKNDAAQFLDFMSDENNAEEAKALGLVKPDVVPVDMVPGPGVQGRGADGRFTAPSAPASGG